MSNIMNRKIQEFIRNNHLFWELDEWDYIENIEDEEHIGDFQYAEFFLLKKVSQKYGFDLNKLKKSDSLEEYEKNVNEEVKKIHGLNTDFNSLPWKRFYKEREKIFSFIDSLDIKDFDIHVESDVWLCDDYLRQFIDLDNAYYILSVFTTFYDDVISKNNSIDVLINEFQTGNIAGHKARMDMIDNYNYSFKVDSFPKTLDKKYDLIVFDLEYCDLEALDKTGLIKLDENGGSFDGDNVIYNIESIVDNLLSKGMAIIKTPFTFVSKLSNDLIDKNIIDKIIYLPEEMSSFAGEQCKVKSVYIIVKKDKDTDGIEFIDKLSGKKTFVKNSIIKKHRGCTNVNIYNKRNVMLEKLYKIKDENEEQLKIISKETEIINKQIDELDFE